jgi:hypothetical protein
MTAVSPGRAREPSGGAMSRVKVNITVSLDGFVAGPNQSEKDPLGIGGEQLHEWLLPLKAFREADGEEGGEVNASTPIAEEILGNVGAAPTSSSSFSPPACSTSFSSPWCRSCSAAPRGCSTSSGSRNRGFARYRRWKRRASPISATGAMPTVIRVRPGKGGCK